MSLLLEALKKAALEKQSKTDLESVNAAVHPQSVEPNSNDTLKPTVEIQPVDGDALPDDPLLDALEDLPDLDLGEAAETFDVQVVTVEAPDLDHHTLILKSLKLPMRNPKDWCLNQSSGTLLSRPRRRTRVRRSHTTN